jgi:predicted Holliday junction resolvase-like endonuclease
LRKGDTEELRYLTLSKMQVKTENPNWNIEEEQVETEKGWKTERRTEEIVTDGWGKTEEWKIEPFLDKKVDWKTERMVQENNINLGKITTY